MIDPATVETIRLWISPVALTAILGVVLSHRLGLFRLKVEARRVEIAAQEVGDKDEADIRDHYSQEVQALRNALISQSERHRAEIERVEGHLRRCRENEDKLLDDSRTLKDIVAGLIRIITQASASRAILLDSEASDYVRAAAIRIDMLFAPRKEKPEKEEEEPEP